MNIGIVTWFRHENYGTILQAIALQRYLRNEGYNVELINFTLPDGVNIKKNKGKKIREIAYYYANRVIYHLYKIIYKSYFIKKSETFKQIVKNNCVITKEITSEKEYIDICNGYDLIIFGSDQIWNPNWYHPFYFGNYNEIKTKLVSYAPSFGVNEIDEEKKAEIRKALSRFTYITTREENGCKIIKNLIDKESQVVVDPTFLLNCDDWSKLEIPVSLPEKDYILCYFLSDNKNHWKAAKRFAKKKGMKLVIVPNEGFSYISSTRVIKDCSVSNFLYLIHNAKYVLTDSFHGTVFSIIYNKQFYIFERHSPSNELSQNSRIYNLLNIIGQSTNLIKYASDNIYKELNLDYSIINENINKKILESKEILNNLIK